MSYVDRSVPEKCTEILPDLRNVLDNMFWPIIIRNSLNPCALHAHFMFLQEICTDVNFIFLLTVFILNKPKMSDFPSD